MGKLDDCAQEAVISCSLSRWTLVEVSIENIFKFVSDLKVCDASMLEDLLN